ncbi:hypothetical protein J6590_025085 [Homalodisca vitripennis]|nr:hypothetical protein J6590_025085 [Homalodisca vitripennis]
MHTLSEHNGTGHTTNNVCIPADSRFCEGSFSCHVLLAGKQPRETGKSNHRTCKAKWVICVTDSVVMCTTVGAHDSDKWPRYQKRHARSTSTARYLCIYVRACACA